MDEYLDQLLCSSPWQDHIDAREKSYWVNYSESDQPNGLNFNSAGADEGDDNNNSPASMFNSNHSTESLAAQDASSIVLGSDSEYGIDKNNLQYSAGEAQFQDDDAQICHTNNTTTNRIAHGSLEVGTFGKQYEMGFRKMGSPNHGPPKTMLGFQRFQKDFQTLCSIPPCPLPCYEGGMSSMPPSNNIGGFGMPYVDNDLFVMESNSKNLSQSVTPKVDDLHNYALPSFASEPQTMLTAAGILQSVPQTALVAPPGECNGSVKPRARARRGQATDPHSIAERVRREKIAERMKNLQELVPNANKTDKASMLDEIIEYVKFLQLQVKVLSMSRLGAAGAVVPLITDSHTEGANGLSLMPSSAGQVPDVLPCDKTSFEREVMKLMESNVTTAMQYLQSKGLCLMPVALATAISNGRESSPCSPYSENWKTNTGFADDLDHKETNKSSNGNSLIDKLSRDSNVVNKCNGAAVKPQEINYSYCTAKELKPKI